MLVVFCFEQITPQSVFMLICCIVQNFTTKFNSASLFFLLLIFHLKGFFKVFKTLLLHLFTLPLIKKKFQCEKMQQTTKIYCTVFLLIGCVKVSVQNLNNRNRTASLKKLYISSFEIAFYKCADLKFHKFETKAFWYQTGNQSEYEPTNIFSYIT